MRGMTSVYPGDFVGIRTGQRKNPEIRPDFNPSPHRKRANREKLNTQ
jgi:hypothetical protein